MQVDLSVNLGKLSLPNPFVVGSGPTVRTVEQIRRADESGWAAASLKLAIDPEPYINLPPRYRWLKKSRLHTFTAEKRLTPRQALLLLEEAKSKTHSILIFPNIAYDGAEPNGWDRMARRFEEAGADAIELNLCCPNMSFNVVATGQTTGKATGASLGADPEGLADVVGEVAEAVRIPVITKLTPEGGRIAEAAAACLQAGAKGVGSAANRLGIPEFDIRQPSIYRLQAKSSLGCLSGPWIRPLALLDTFQIRRRNGPRPFILGSGGVSDLKSAVQQIMAGADALWICTETMLRGFDWISRLIDRLAEYMRTMGYRRISDFRDLIHGEIVSAEKLRVYDGYAEIDRQKCNACEQCWSLGHCVAISHPNQETRIDRELCLACSTCVDVCPRNAISMRAV
jgi:dihydroorotate dehydrogenase/ferredoxin